MMKEEGKSQSCLQSFAFIANKNKRSQSLFGFFLLQLLQITKIWDSTIHRGRTQNDNVKHVCKYDCHHWSTDCDLKRLMKNSIPSSNFLHLRSRYLVHKWTYLAL